uniref:Optineurin n=1 Tax=Echeneis naucrates TaxID=173247 RepID=A0A665U4J0_ECHNA
MNGDISRSPGQYGTLEETLQQMNILIQENRDLKEALRRKLEEEGKAGGAAELDALRAQVARLQAEKNDLVAMNSELQLKADQNSLDDDFIEVIRVSVRSNTHRQTHDSKEGTVSQLLQSLRNETQRADQLQMELQDAAVELKLDMLSLIGSVYYYPNIQAASEVENLKSQMITLFKELQQAQSKLDEAEGMKRNLQDRCRDVEQDVATLKAQLVEKQAVQSENDRLKLQLDSMQAQSQMEQKKAGEERNTLAQLKDAYTKLFEDYNELKEENKKRELVQKDVVDDLQDRLTAAEEALAVKQTKIDDMKVEIFQKEKELETISVFQAQAEVYSSDFYAERAAREKLHEEKERLVAQLNFVKRQNTQLQEEMDSLGRRSLNEMQRRHMSREGNQLGAGATLVGRGTIVFFALSCDQCLLLILPDLDSLQIHIMDCIN